MLQVCDNRDSDSPFAEVVRGREVMTLLDNRNGFLRDAGCKRLWTHQKSCLPCQGQPELIPDCHLGTLSVPFWRV